ncbi:MAG: RNA methyltransferase [Bacilli bacterium]
MIYKSLDNNYIKQLKKLQQKKYRDQMHEFLIETPHLVTEAYNAGCLKQLIVEENTVFDLKVDSIKVAKKVIDYLSQLKSSNNVMGLGSYNENKQIEGNKILILDNIQDPGNLGTIIRSAVAFNIDTIILSKDSVDIYNSKVLRASQGMVFHINIIIGDLLKVIPELKRQHFKIVTTKVATGGRLKDFSKTLKFAIIMGNEGNGISKEIQEISDEFLHIDISKKCESLNVAIATSIILYEISR